MTKEEVLAEAQKQIDSFKKQIAELNEKASALSSDAKTVYIEQKKELEELLDEAEVKFKALKAKASDSWNETRDFVLLTQKALKHSFNYFMSHYKTKE